MSSYAKTRKETDVKLRVKYWRERRAMSVRRLAETAKVTPQTIVNAEKGRRNTHPTTIENLAKALNISIDELIEDEPAQAR
jgi:transcriptional regulator with XRE-family HTH domain